MTILVYLGNGRKQIGDEKDEDDDDAEGEIEMTEKEQK